MRAWKNATGTVTVRFDDLNRREREQLFNQIGKRIRVDKRDEVKRFLGRIGAYGPQG